MYSHSPRGSVDWNVRHVIYIVYKQVTPLAGVWIEIWKVFRHFLANFVTPLAGVWIEIDTVKILMQLDKVTPLAGVWIEIDSAGKVSWRDCVTPLAGVWIEIGTSGRKSMREWMSLPSRECGLKSVGLGTTVFEFSHSPRGSVDWNCVGLWRVYGTVSHSPRGSVDWNCYLHNSSTFSVGHSPRGSVDWNKAMGVKAGVPDLSLPSRECGLKYCWCLRHLLLIVSLPSRECGLKLRKRPLCRLSPWVTPLAGVWIEMQIWDEKWLNTSGHSPRGSVDWNPAEDHSDKGCRGHSPRGSVDWNNIDHPKDFKGHSLPLSGVQ